ncbi:unnamed protein product [Blepharisma stoltei]|uniref:Uncharacterized protein n=1 Tax=Blepharisma stoltei TaxID=1481888 RepID=A0AAU9IUC6_9CILI|nr:unnamed protein product [Blepharisma stoltei]
MALLIFCILPIVLTCDFPDLPPLISYLSPAYDETNHLEASGRFLVPKTSITWDISVSVDSWFRIKAEPLNHDLQLSIYQNNFILKATESVQDEFLAISQKLNIGNYKITFEFINTINNGETDSLNENDCKLPNLYLNIGIHPYTRLKELIPATLSDYQEGFPDLSKVNDALKSLDLFSETYSENYIKISDIPNEDSALKTYTFHNPVINDDMKDIGFTGIWKVTLSIHHDFLTSGGIGILLSNNNKKKITNFSKLSCIAKGDCLIGKRVDKNAITLYTGFSTGDFYLTIFYAGMTSEEKEMLKSIGNKIPFSIHANLEPVLDKEDRFNCEAAHIPHSLNSPGLLDSKGFLRYSDRLIADFFSPIQYTEFEISQKSVIRIVTVEPSGIDVDILLKELNGKEIEKSSATGESEGILKVINEGKYRIEYRLANSLMSNPRHKFCETFMLEIGISPFEAVEGLVEYLGLNSCRDDSDELQNEFLKINTILSSKNANFEMNADDKKFYKVPIKSIWIGEEEVFRANFNIETTAYCYFDIYSDFVINDFTISLEKQISKKKRPELIRGDTSDMLKLGKHNRRSFQGELGPGIYTFKIWTGPTSKEIVYGESVVKTKKDSNLNILPNCGAFQLRIHVFAVKEEKLRNWACYEKDAQLIPSTFNTLDKLGVKDTPTGLLPATQYFSLNIVAPNSKQNDISHDITFYFEAETFLRVIIESQSSPMKISLKKGSKIEIIDESATKRLPSIYSLNQVLEKHQLYTLEISYYPINSDFCHTYTALISLIPTADIEKGYLKSCTNLLPDANFITERLLDTSTFSLFGFNNENGLSSLSNEPSYQFLQSCKPLKIEIPFTVTTEAAMMTGHLQSNFALSGIILELAQDDEIVHWGSFYASHRFELPPIPVPKGEYTLIIEEIEKSAIKTCASFSASVIAEDVSLWDDLEALVRKTETCAYIDQPQSLNLVGQLQSGNLHWHKLLKLDTILESTSFEFSVFQDSIIRVFIVPQTEILFTINLIKKSRPIERLFTVDISQLSDGLHSRISPGDYILEITYSSEYGMTSHKLCPTFEMDLDIKLLKDYNKLASKFICSGTAELPTVFDGKTSISEMSYMHNSKPLNHLIEVNLDKDTEIEARIAFENIFSGYISMELLKNNAVIGKSVGIENFSELLLPLPKGNYKLQIISSYNAELPNACWPLELSIQTEESKLELPVVGAMLPGSLKSKDAEAFGGPQAKDGSIDFEGTFIIKENIDSEVMKIYAPEHATVNIKTVSNSPDVMIESGIYQDKNFREPLDIIKHRKGFKSHFYELQPRKEPYYLLLTYTKEQSFKKSTTFDLKIVINAIKVVEKPQKENIESTNQEIKEKEVVAVQENNENKIKATIKKAEDIKNQNNDEPENVRPTDPVDPYNIEKDSQEKPSECHKKLGENKKNDFNNESQIESENNDGMKDNFAKAKKDPFSNNIKIKRDNEIGWSTYVYYIFYITIGLAAVYFISHMQKAPAPVRYEPIKMKKQKHTDEDEDIIDLRSTRFDSKTAKIEDN